MWRGSALLIGGQLLCAALPRLASPAPWFAQAAVGPTTSVGGEVAGDAGWCYELGVGRRIVPGLTWTSTLAALHIQGGSPGITIPELHIEQDPTWVPMLLNGLHLHLPVSRGPTPYLYGGLGPALVMPGERREWDLLSPPYFVSTHPPARLRMAGMMGIGILLPSARPMPGLDVGVRFLELSRNEDIGMAAQLRAAVLF